MAEVARNRYVYAAVKTVYSDVVSLTYTYTTYIELTSVDDITSRTDCKYMYMCTGTCTCTCTCIVCTCTCTCSSTGDAHVDHSIAVICGSTIDVSVAAGVLTSPNYPDVYDNYLRCEWTLVASEGSRVSLTFDTFHVATCRGQCACDVLSVSVIVA